MKFKSIIILALFTFLNCGCTWTSYQTKNKEIVWKKEFKSKPQYSDTMLNSCLQMGNKNIKIKDSLNNSYFYEFDSIRVYVPKTEKLLNQIVQKGLLSGQMFFSPISTDYCHPLKWANPVKSLFNNWDGYNLIVNNLQEIRTNKIPKQIKGKINMYKVYELLLMHGQPFINPAEFQIRIENPNYKANIDTISFDLFLQTAKVTRFYQSAVQI